MDIERPPYNFSVWVITGLHEDRKVSTFTLPEAEAWRDYLAGKIDKVQRVVVKFRDY